MQKPKGKVIAAFGIPGSGKSTTIKYLGNLLNLKSLHEPEEKYWPYAVTHRKISGNFTAIMWFRAMRVPLLYQADQLRKDGMITLLDSFYDKLFPLYMNNDGLQWLFDKTDAYYDEMIGIAQKDYNSLPDAECIIFFKIDYNTWLKFLTKRNRNLDNDIEFRNKCFESQNFFLLAAQKYSKERNCELIVYQQKLSSPASVAKEIASELRFRKIIL